MHTKHVLNSCTNPKIRSKWIWETHITGESRKNEVPHLNAVWRNYVTEREVVITKELRKIM